jgi:hypothetical protein
MGRAFLNVGDQQHQPEALVEEGAGDRTLARHPREPVLETVQDRLDAVVHEGQTAQLLADAPEGGQGPLGQRLLADEAPVELAGDPGHLAEEGVAQSLYLLLEVSRDFRGRDPVELVAKAETRLDERGGIDRFTDRCLPLRVQCDPVLDRLTVTRNKRCALLREGLAERIELRGHGLGLFLGDGVAAQEAHAAREADTLRLLLDAVEHPDLLGVADALGAQGHQVLGRFIGTEGEVLGGELLAPGPDPDIQVDRHQAVEYLHRLHGTSLPRGARARPAAEHGRRCRR